MKNTINVFSGGLTTDLHPLQVQNTQLTDALNATFLTYNGNELMLQNDMGNTLIQDSVTGSIMGLKEGFIPVGIKEHGGVLYIASFNPAKQQSELGSIPSPIFSYTYQTYPIKEQLEYTCFYADTFTAPIASIRLLDDGCIFSVGDGFSCGLEIENGTAIIQRNADNLPTAIKFPILSTRKEAGLVTLHVIAESTDGKTQIDLQEHKYRENPVVPQEDNWYELMSPGSDLSIPTYKTIYEGGTVKYPNFKTGWIRIQPVVETISNVCLPINESTGIREPIINTINGITVTVSYKDLTGFSSVFGSSSGANSYINITVEGQFDNPSPQTILMNSGETNTFVSDSSIKLTLPYTVSSSPYSYFNNGETISSSPASYIKEITQSCKIDITFGLKGSVSVNGLIGSGSVIIGGATGSVINPGTGNAILGGFAEGPSTLIPGFSAGSENFAGSVTEQEGTLDPMV